MLSRVSKFHLNFLIAVLTVIAYFPTFQNDFVDYDDNSYVTDNPYVKKGLNPASVVYALTSLDTGNYTPITILAYEAQVTLFGVNPRAMHASNLILHLANSLLLFRFLRLMTNTLYRSALVALFFAVHPLHVESVAWISELKDLLSTFFLLLTLLSYLRYCENPKSTTYLLSLLFFAIGLLSKSMLVTLPFLLAMMDVWILRRWKAPENSAAKTSKVTPADRTRDKSRSAPSEYPQKSFTGLIYEKLPFFGLSFMIGVITIVAQAVKGAVGTTQEFPFRFRVANAISAYGVYLVKTIYPTDLCFLYLHPLKSVSVLPVIVGAVLLATLSFWAWWRCRNEPLVAFGWMWFLITLLPVIGLFQVGIQAYADRYTYIPHIGLFVMIVWEAQSLLMRFPKPRIWSWIFSIAATLSFVLLTSLQVRTWRNTETLMLKAIAVNPENYAAYAYLGNFLMKHGSMTGALSLFEMSIRINPNESFVHSDLGVALTIVGQTSKAEEQFVRAIELDPYSEKAVQSLAYLYWTQNRHDAALACIKNYAERDPSNSRTQLTLARFYWESGELEKSEQAFQRALRLRPSDGELRQKVEECLQQLKEQMKAAH